MVKMDLLADVEEVGGVTAGVGVAGWWSLKRYGCCKALFRRLDGWADRFRRWEARHPRLAAAVADIGFAVGATFLLYDISTDWALFFTVAGEGHYVDVFSCELAADSSSSCPASSLDAIAGEWNCKMVCGMQCVELATSDQDHFVNVDRGVTITCPQADGANVTAAAAWGAAHSAGECTRELLWEADHSNPAAALLAFIVLPAILCAFGMCYYLKTFPGDRRNTSLFFTGRQGFYWLVTIGIIGAFAGAMFGVGEKMQCAMRSSRSFAWLQHAGGDFLGAVVGFLLPFMLVYTVCDILMVIRAVPVFGRRFRTGGKYVDGEAAMAIESYTSTRTLVECLFESLPQIALQLHLQASGRLDVDSEAVLQRALVVSILNTLYVVCDHAWKMKCRKMNVKLYIKMVLQIGGGRAGNIATRIANKDAELDRVDLRNSDVTDFHVWMLAKALKENAIVTRIDLSSNNFITDKGGRALLDALRINTTVREVVVDYTRISDALVRSITSLAQDPTRGRPAPASNVTNPNEVIVGRGESVFIRGTKVAPQPTRRLPLEKSEGGDDVEGGGGGFDLHRYAAAFVDTVFAAAGK